MVVIRAARRERLTQDNRPQGCPASSAGQFVIRADGTARFDRHHHNFAEFWFIASGSGTLAVAGVHHEVGPGDIVYTPAGHDHDIIDVAEELRIFWLSAELPSGSTGAHLHADPQDAEKHQVPVRERVTDAPALRTSGIGKPTVTLPFPRTAKYGRAEQDVVQALMATGRLSETGRGPATTALENAFSALVGVDHSLAFNSGTASLHAALHAVGAHPQVGVATSPLTWISALTATFQAGSFPVFHDLAPDSLALDPESLANHSRERDHSAVLVTHAYGVPAEMDALLAAAGSVPVVEDCSHAHGAAYRGRMVGSWGAAGCFSLQDSKSASGGEGGVLTTSDRAVYERAMTLGHHPHRFAGELRGPDLLGLIDTGAAYKYRIHPLAAGIAQVQLGKLGHRMAMADLNLTALRRALADLRAPLAVTELDEGSVRGWYGTPLTVTVDVPDAQALADGCTAAGVPLRRLYPDWLRAPLLQDPALAGRFWPHLEHCAYKPPAPQEYPNYYRARNRTLVLKIPTVHAPDYMEQVATALAHVLAENLP
ncbi:DegT/DnrJ/EryC1/StrS family aminotransferase [Embleya sp. NPDC059237]|uniref:DegT/DnrJ/EryC1/StrS family aminotransferase n=1 Tax=Embleya sp. NPDC059237 TaxID=3346784 RepID=UPI0036C6D79D